SHSRDFEIVGIVEDAKYQEARQPAYATFFLPFLQVVRPQEPGTQHAIDGSNFMQSIELLVAGHPGDLESMVRRTLSDTDPNLTVLDTMSLREQASRNFNQDRLRARLTALLAGLALHLPRVG